MSECVEVLLGSGVVELVGEVFTGVLYKSVGK